MTDLNIVTLALAGLAGLGIATLAALKGWQGWLDVRRLEIGGQIGGRGNEHIAPSPTSRIELADLKERVRKLEGIAAGVDL